MCNVLQPLAPFVAQEAGQRLMQVAHDPRCSKSGVYWSWNGGPREGRGEEALEQDGQILGGGGAGGGWDSIYENDQSDKVLNKELATELFECSTAVSGAEWPTPYQPRPVPLEKQVVGNVVDTIAKMLYASEEAKRREPKPGMVGAEASAAEEAQLQQKVDGVLLEAGLPVEGAARV